MRQAFRADWQGNHFLAVRPRPERACEAPHALWPRHAWFQLPPLPSAEPRVPGVQAEDRADHHERGRGAKPAVVHLALVRPVRFLGGAGLLPVCVVGPAVMDYRRGRYLCCGPGQYGWARPLLVLWARPVWIGAAVTSYVWARPLRMGRYELCSAGMDRCASSRPGDARALSRGADDCERPRPSGT